MQLNPFSALTSKIFGAVALVLLFCLPLSYCKGRSDGKQVVLERLERAEQKAAQKAVKAASAADEKVKAKTEIFEAEQDVLRKAIDDAEAQDENALDAIF